MTAALKTMTAVTVWLNQSETTTRWAIFGREPVLGDPWGFMGRH